MLHYSLSAFLFLFPPPLHSSLTSSRTIRLNLPFLGLLFCIPYFIQDYFVHSLPHIVQYYFFASLTSYKTIFCISFFVQDYFLISLPHPGLFPVSLTSSRTISCLPYLIQDYFLSPLPHPGLFPVSLTSIKGHFLAPLPLSGLFPVSLTSSRTSLHFPPHFYFLLCHLRVSSPSPLLSISIRTYCTVYHREIIYKANQGAW